MYSAYTTLPLSRNPSYLYLGEVAPESAKFSSSITCVGDGSSRILAAVERCGINDTITLPAPCKSAISSSRVGCFMEASTISPQGNSTNMIFLNLTCISGGIALGSIEQYKDSPDNIINVITRNISVSQSISPP